jgi:flagellar basal-body rod protein FlgC
VAAVTLDEAEPRKVYQPGHPDADTQGFVAYPNINVVTTMSDLMTATRLYQANVTAADAIKQMQAEAGRIITA